LYSLLNYDTIASWPCGQEAIVGYAKRFMISHKPLFSAKILTTASQVTASQVTKNQVANIKSSSNP